MVSHYSVSELRRLCLVGVISATDYFLFRKLKRINTKHHKRIFNFDALSDDDCYEFFRFNKSQILELKTELLLPETCRTERRVSFSGIEGLCILLRRLSYPSRYSELIPMFRRDESSLSQIILWMLDYIFYTFKHLLESVNHSWLKPSNLYEFAQATQAVGCPYLNIVGFIDGTARPICKPTRNQQMQYNGYEKQHVLKYQSVMFPNGIIGRLDGPINGRRHDSDILDISKLLDDLGEHFVMQDGSWFALYGDPGYLDQKFINVAYKKIGLLTYQQLEFNSQISSLRMNVEYGFRKIVQLFAFVDNKKNQKLLQQNLKKQYAVAALLTNCHTCLNGSQIASFFSCSPPSLHAYLHN